MIQFSITIQQFGKQGEKTGWSYIPVSEEQAAELKPSTKVSFRVKGSLDDYKIEQVALLPMGDGSFIMPLNVAMRKGIRKSKGDTVHVRLALDTAPIAMDADFIECLNDEPNALRYFQQLPKGHQNYFSKWIESAKTAPTKAKRIAMAVTALSKGWGYSEMIRAEKKTKQDLGL